MRWKIDENLGHGKFGVVFSARPEDSGDEWSHALKRLQSDWLGIDEARKRFKRETDIQSSLDHPNVIPVVDAGESSTKGPWFVMPRATAGSLKDAIKDGRAAEEEWSLAVFDQVLAGVAHAHEQRIMHRDIKPSNVLMFGDVPRIADFGIARQLDNDGTTLTHTAEQLGTFRYMAPEQLREAKKAGLAADVYALGKVLGHMLSGIEPEPFKLSLHGVPSTYRVFIDRCCREDPSERFQTAGDALARFRRIGAPIDIVLPPLEQGLELAQSAEASLLTESQVPSIESLHAHFREHSADQTLYMEVLPQISPDLTQAWLDHRVDDFRQAIVTYDGMLEQSNLAFGYCDVVARFYREIFRRTDDIALKRLAMTRLIVMGHQYNRFYVHDLVTDLLPALDDACDIEIAEEVIAGHQEEASWYAATALKGSLAAPIASALRAAQASMAS